MKFYKNFFKNSEYSNSSGIVNHKTEEESTFENFYVYHVPEPYSRKFVLNLNMEDIEKIMEKRGLTEVNISPHFFNSITFSQYFTGLYICSEPYVIK